jgi:hypothetical protein
METSGKGRSVKGDRWKVKSDRWYSASTFVLSVSLADVAKGGGGAKSALWWKSQSAKALGSWPELLAWVKLLEMV